MALSGHGMGGKGRKKGAVAAGESSWNRRHFTSRMIIDSHLHCGVQNVSWGWDRLKPLLVAAGIQGAGLIPPVEDIYDRYNPRFTDPPAWQACRRQAHAYLLKIARESKNLATRQDPAEAPAPMVILPYFFVWNDFARENLTPEYVAIKWHRHGDEPEYHYTDPRCREFLEAVRRRGLPILLEETFQNTLFFLERLASDLPVIIPHLGGLNGGYQALRRAGVWDLPLVYGDTALAPVGEIQDYLGRYGPDRLIFGSDYPFGHPGAELAKIRGLNLPEAQVKAILGENFLGRCGRVIGGE